MAQTGILQRRDLKANLEANPPIDGEIVLATDTNEYGWANGSGGVIWKDLQFMQPIKTVTEPPTGLEADDIGTVYLVVTELISIAVTPQNGDIDTGTTQTVQYTATGTYGDGTTSDITSDVSWVNDDPTNVAITINGLASYLNNGTAYDNIVTITATLKGVSGIAPLNLYWGG